MAAYAGLELGFAWGWEETLLGIVLVHTCGAKELAILECLLHMSAFHILPQLIVLPLLRRRY